MLFAYLLASALAMSAVLGRSAIPTSRQVTYENEHKTTMQLNKTAQMVAVGDRSSNLKYVMAIQSSTIWEDIKKRSLTINTAQGLDGAVAEKSPNNLTDQELAQLKQACHDGLKCVAVDQLLVLKQVSEPLGDGKVSVRTAITKITQVLTQYTTEYHEDVYQYEAVQQSDDQSKVYKSVTTIVEDNKDLCQIDLTPVTDQSQPKNGDSNTIPAAVDNNRTVNYNTINNYNINNGTVNSATINIDPKSSGSVDVDVSNHEKPPVDTNAHAAATDGPAVIESKNPSPDHPDVNADHQPMALATVNSTPAATDVQTGDGSITKVAKTDSPLESTRGSETTDRPVTTTDDHPENAPQTTDDQPKPIGQQLMITDGPSPRDGEVSGNGSAADNDTDNSGRERKYRRPRRVLTGQAISADGNTTAEPEPAANNKIVSKRSNGTDASDRLIVTKDIAADGVDNNTVELDNSSGGKAGGENDSDSDIVSAGSHNKQSSKKGLVEDGFLNNGNMKVDSVDNSNRNKGTIKGAKANNGIINVGTTNNGPVNYGTSKAYTNNGTTSDMKNYDIRQYVDHIDKMYSRILDELAKK